jgi:hypothetical protein
MKPIENVRDISALTYGFIASKVNRPGFAGGCLV